MVVYKAHKIVLFSFMLLCSSCATVRHCHHTDEKIVYHVFGSLENYISGCLKRNDIKRQVVFAIDPKALGSRTYPKEEIQGLDDKYVISIVNVLPYPDVLYDRYICIKGKLYPVSLDRTDVAFDYLSCKLTEIRKYGGNSLWPEFGSEYNVIMVDMAKKEFHSIYSRPQE